MRTLKRKAEKTIQDLMIIIRSRNVRREIPTAFRFFSLVERNDCFRHQNTTQLQDLSMKPTAEKSHSEV